MPILTLLVELVQDITFQVHHIPLKIFPRAHQVKFSWTDKKNLRTSYQALNSALAPLVLAHLIVHADVARTSGMIERFESLAKPDYRPSVLVKSVLIPTDSLDDEDWERLLRSISISITSREDPTDLDSTTVERMLQPLGEAVGQSPQIESLAVMYPGVRHRPRYGEDPGYVPSTGRVDDQARTPVPDSAAVVGVLEMLTVAGIFPPQLCAQWKWAADGTLLPYLRVHPGLAQLGDSVCTSWTSCTA
ncbi:hypothetical protein DFH09DRAFT_1312096 [Mycena vulgaris]|nr:hypothetical protein DFH09DRAFT_1312096 [Mycena vulgaris]